MEFSANGIRYSAHDLIAFVNCRHLAAQNLAVAKEERRRPSPQSSFLQRLLELGKEHEENYIKHLRSSGYNIVCVEGVDVFDDAVKKTTLAMQSGVQVIYQGALANKNWVGRTDILFRVEGNSAFGDWSYEAVDVKLANKTKASTILQLCLYSDLLSDVQNLHPEYMHVVPPSADYGWETYRVSNYSAYYRRAVRELIAATERELIEGTYPNLVEHCGVCNYFAECNSRRRNDDHLCFVANISKLQIEVLKDNGISTLTELSELPVPISWKPSKGSKEGYQHVREQARIQKETLESGTLEYELLPITPGFGLSCLPRPCDGDIFFDIESSRFAADGGADYLFGHLAGTSNGDMKYSCTWSLSREREKAAFEEFVDFAMNRWNNHPDMHIYHYGHHEPVALKRLMGRYASKEDEVDNMLRADLFVDLHRVVKHSIRAGVEGYSLKELEPLFGYEREVPVEIADEALGIVRKLVEGSSGQYASEEDKLMVEKYNRDDCVSTCQLRDWLEAKRTLLKQNGTVVERPVSKNVEVSQKLSEWQAKCAKLVEALTEDVPPDKNDWNEEQHSRWLLANVLDWHRREDKGAWWEYYRLLGLSEGELLDEKGALVGLEFVGIEAGHKAKSVDVYKYSPQETDVRVKDDLFTLDDEKFGEVDRILYDDGVVHVAKSRNSKGQHASAVISRKIIGADVIRNALARVAEHVAENGMNGMERYGVAKDILLRSKIQTTVPVKLPTGAENPSDEAVRLCISLLDGVLVIQGPPGAGKTYTGARMICELVRQNKKVGIAAHSHKVIENLLKKAKGMAADEGVAMLCCKKNGEDGDLCRREINVVKRNEELINGLQSNINVGAATAWFWSREDVENLVDVLFVDEAAQMSLANVLAISHAARAMVLLGDTQQLTQPIRGSHPDGTEVSAMKHLVGNQQTISQDSGLFLSETWRMHPDICEYTSEAFYESRLQPRHGLDGQRICGEKYIDGSGLRYCLVEHEGNTSSSIEEAKTVSRIVERILSSNTTWIDRNGEEQKITLDDMLITTPYNAQVQRISSFLPNARVGTVDKFQGQEAPIAIYSTATSSGDLAPRGMNFLYNLNRLNVATSRSKCLCILICSPRLLDVECHSPSQIELANAFCRYLEMAKEIMEGDLGE